MDHENLGGKPDDGRVAQCRRPGVGLSADDDQMISMRYARNLVEGHGLAWNPGERVEGYADPLQTCVMA